MPQVRIVCQESAATAQIPAGRQRTRVEDIRGNSKMETSRQQLAIGHEVIGHEVSYITHTNNPKLLQIIKSHPGLIEVRAHHRTKLNQN